MVVLGMESFGKGSAGQGFSKRKVCLGSVSLLGAEKGKLLVHVIP